MPDDVRLRIEIKNNQPVELLDLTKSFVSFAEEYRRFLAKNDDLVTTDEVKLYIQEIRAGSIVTDVVALAALGLPYMENAKTLLEYGKYLGSAYDFLTGKQAGHQPMDRAEFENLASFVEPVAKDSASQLNCSTVINGDLNVVFSLSSVEANAVQNTARRAIETLKEPEKGLKAKVLMYWFQTRSDPSSTVGDRAIIESISPRPVKVVFVDEAIKASMMLDQENPFKYAYVVDVSVETIQGRPALYRVETLHEKVEPPPPGDEG